MKLIIALNNDIYALFALYRLKEFLQKHDIYIIYTQSVSEPPPYLTTLVNFEKELYQQISLQHNLNSITNPIEILKLNGDRQEKKLKINNFLTKNKADLIISIRFGYIFQNDEINLSNFGIINLHSGILPNYKGIMASFHALYNNEQELGTTLHFIEDKKIDEGSIIKISKSKADYNKSYLYQVFNLYKAGCMDIVIFAQQILAKKTPPLKREKGGRYFSYPQENKFKQYLDSGKKLFNLEDKDYVLSEFSMKKTS